MLLYRGSLQLSSWDKKVCRSVQTVRTRTLWRVEDTTSSSILAVIPRVPHALALPKDAVSFNKQSYRHYFISILNDLDAVTKYSKVMGVM